MNYYDLITKKEVEDILKNVEWVLLDKEDNGDVNDDGQSSFLKNCYSGIQTFGLIDYKDHRKDSLKILIKEVSKNMLDCRSQRLHFYDDNGKGLKKMGVKGYLGGYTGYFIGTKDE